MRRLLTRIVAVFPTPIAEMLRRLKRSTINRRGAKKVFQDIYSKNIWDDAESVSGPGSNMESTANVRAELPALLTELNIKHILDVPCGDANWIGQCLPKGIKYTGGDIVPEIIAKNNEIHGSWGEFIVCDLITDKLPMADIILVRDCFIHLPNKMVVEALKSIQASGIPYILTTTQDRALENSEIELGGYRPINLCLPPFNAAPPERFIKETFHDQNQGQSLGLWRLDIITQSLQN